MQLMFTSLRVYDSYTRIFCSKKHVTKKKWQIKWFRHNIISILVYETIILYW